MEQVNIVWKHIPGLSAGYEVSNLGTIRLNFIDHVEPIKIHTAKNGESMIYAGGRQLRVHRIVAEAFLPIPEDTSGITGKWIVNHKDGDVSNNAVDNLEWISYAESAKKSYHAGKLKGTRVYCVETDQIYATIQTAAAYTQLQICAVEYGLTHGVKMYGYTFEPVGEDVPYTDMVLLTKQQIIELGKESNSSDISKLI